MKKIILLTSITTFLFVNVSVHAADCSNYKTFSHKWNMCKVGKLQGVESDTNSEVKSKRKLPGAGSIKGFWNKIRTFGGKEVGSEG